MIVIKIEDKEVRGLLARLQKRGENLRPVMSEIGEILISSVEENFQRGGRYSRAGSTMGGSKKWKSLATSTIRQREREGKWPGQILVKSAGGLAPSVAKRVTNNSVIIGTNKIYAAIQQFGGKAGRGHKTKIPARPYLVIQDEDMREIREVLREHILKAVTS